HPCLCLLGISVAAGAPRQPTWDMEGRPGVRSIFQGTHTRRRTCHFVVSPGFSVTIPVSMPFHSLPKGSAKLYWSSIAANCAVGGEYIWMVLICGESPSTATP